MFEFVLELLFTTRAIAFLLLYYSFSLVLQGLGHRGVKAHVRVRARIRAPPHQLAQQPRPYSPGALKQKQIALEVP